MSLQRSNKKLDKKNAQCPLFEVFDANAKNTKIKKRTKEEKRVKSKNGTIYSILHVQTAMKYLVTYSQCKIAKANCTNSASYDENRKKREREIVLLVRDSRTECLSFGLIFLHTEIL